MKTSLSAMQTAKGRTLRISTASRIQAEHKTTRRPYLETPLTQRYLAMPPRRRTQGSSPHRARTIDSEEESKIHQECFIKKDRKDSAKWKSDKDGQRETYGRPPFKPQDRKNNKGVDSLEAEEGDSYVALGM